MDRFMVKKFDPRHKSQISKNIAPAVRAMLTFLTTAHGDHFPMRQIILFFDALQDYCIVKLNT